MLSENVERLQKMANDEYLRLQLLYARAMMCCRPAFSSSSRRRHRRRSHHPRQLRCLRKERGRYLERQLAMLRFANRRRAPSRGAEMFGEQLLSVTRQG